MIVELDFYGRNPKSLAYFWRQIKVWNTTGIRYGTIEIDGQFPYVQNSMQKINNGDYGK